VVNSLQINDPTTCKPCSASPQNYYYYNTSNNWVAESLFGLDLAYCNVALEVIAPTQLIVTGTLSILQDYLKGQLRLVSQPSNLTERAYVPYLRIFVTSADASPMNQIYNCGNLECGRRSYLWGWRSSWLD